MAPGRRAIRWRPLLVFRDAVALLIEDGSVPPGNRRQDQPSGEGQRDPVTRTREETHSLYCADDLSASGFRPPLPATSCGRRRLAEQPVTSFLRKRDHCVTATNETSCCTGGQLVSTPSARFRISRSVSGSVGSLIRLRKARQRTSWSSASCSSSQMSPGRRSGENSARPSRWTA
jgi:hypothetical protein